jgi:hypothetical protein
MKRWNPAARLLAALGLTLCFTGTALAGELETLQQEWWQWAMAIPASHNPIFDKNGNRCGIAQRGDVWFLAGSTGGKVNRTCAVPEGVKLFVPAVNTFCFPDAAFSDSFCVTDSDNFIDSFLSGTVEITVDGTPVTVTDVRDETDFNFAVDANGIFGAKPGIYRATIARGFWSLIEPLEPGAHVVTIDAAGPLFGLSVTYQLNVVSPAN